MTPLIFALIVRHALIIYTICVYVDKIVIQHVGELAPLGKTR